MQVLDIQITYDFICPWCWIGHAHLKQALALAALPLEPVLHYRPYELNPTMPRTGMDRREYRSAKFGSWAHSQALDAEVTVAGRRAGLDFQYGRMTRTPNTRLAHRLMLHARARGGAHVAAELFDGIFAAYFREGRDIGDATVLMELAIRAGLSDACARELLTSAEVELEVVTAEVQARRDGVHSVPSLRIGPMVVSGAQPAMALAEILSKTNAAIASKAFA